MSVEPDSAVPSIYMDMRVYPDDDAQEMRMTLTIDCAFQDVPGMLASMQQPSWSQNVIDTINAGAAGLDLGITRSSRQFMVRLDDEEEDVD